MLSQTVVIVLVIGVLVRFYPDTGAPQAHNWKKPIANRSSDKSVLGCCENFCFTNESSAQYPLQIDFKVDGTNECLVYSVLDSSWNVTRNT